MHPGPSPAQVPGVGVLWGFLHTAHAYLCPGTLLPTHQHCCRAGASPGLPEDSLRQLGRGPRVPQPAWGTLGSRVASELHPPACSTSESLPALSSGLQAAFQPQPSPDSSEILVGRAPAWQGGNSLQGPSGQPQASHSSFPITSTTRGCCSSFLQHTGKVWFLQSASEAADKEISWVYGHILPHCDGVHRGFRMREETRI